MIVDKTQLLLKKCINDKQKLKQTKDMLFVIHFFLLSALQRFILKKMFLLNISHCTSHIKMCPS